MAPTMQGTWTGGWQCDEPSKVVEAMAGCAGCLQVAAFLSEECIGPVDQLVVSDCSVGEGAGLQVAPLVRSIFRGMQSALANWPALHEYLVDIDMAAFVVKAGAMKSAVTYLRTP